MPVLLLDLGGPVLDERVVVGQRLVRRLCPDCKVEVAESRSDRLLEVGVAPEQGSTFRLYEGRGCGTCDGTGYKGRLGLFEVLEVSDGIRDLALTGAASAMIERRALEGGLVTLRKSGIAEMEAGLQLREGLPLRPSPEVADLALA